MNGSPRLAALRSAVEQQDEVLAAHGVRLVNHDTRLTRGARNTAVLRTAVEQQDEVIDELSGVVAGQTQRIAGAVHIATEARDAVRDQNQATARGMEEFFPTITEFERWKKSSGAGPINWIIGAVAFVVLLVLAASYGDDLAIALHGPHFQGWVITVLIAASLMLAVGIMLIASSSSGGSTVFKRTTTTERTERPQPALPVASTEVMPAVVAPATASPPVHAAV